MAQSSALRYEVLEGWEQLPAGHKHRDVTGVAVDSEDRVYLICRGDQPIIVHDSGGRFLRSWCQGEFTYRTHGISVGPDEMLYCADDGNHTIRKFTPDGKLRITLGTMNTPRHGPVQESRYGRVSVFDRDGRILARWGSPDAAVPGSFAAPHGLAVDSRGDISVVEVTWTFAVSRGHAREDCRGRAGGPGRARRQ